MDKNKMLIASLSGTTPPSAMPRYLAKKIYDAISEDVTDDDVLMVTEEMLDFTKRFPWADIDFSKISQWRIDSEVRTPSEYEDGTLVIKDGKFLYYIDGVVATRAKTREKLESLLMKKYGKIDIVEEIIK